jgi:Tol biopolymer transport system component
LFLTDRDGSWRLYRMDADGSNQRPFLPSVLRDIPLAYEFAAECVASWGP